MPYCLVESPLGPLTLEASETGLRALRLGAHPPEDDAEAPEHPMLAEAVRQLDAYFAGTRSAFDLPLDLQGTPFQRQVWALLREIPYGETTTYGALATRLGGVGKSRAVGLANGKNPVAIIVPCHRVVGTAGALTGFAGGLAAKAFLLRHEGAYHAPAGQADLFG